MNILFQILFWLSIGGLLHTYLFYPFLLKILTSGKKNNDLVFNEEGEWPKVSVVISVFNEEKVIERKLKGLLELDYPEDKITIFIGSDSSEDDTNRIVASYSQKYSNIHFFPFEQRRGKPEVVNDLVEKAKRFQASSELHLLLITDANVMLMPQTLKALTKHFKNEKIAIVDAHMIHTGIKAEGISKAEDRYISGEGMLKHREGILWGKMIGPFGGCYVIQADLYSKVPPAFLVDDFYITMKVLEKGGQAINDLDAICYEAVSHEIKEEYRRKARISAGNVQNLITFRHLWWPPFNILAFAFFSHKILRWFGPFLILVAILTSIALSLGGGLVYLFAFLIFVLFFFIIPLMDLILNALNINILPLRGVRYFVLMNIALLEGFFKYLKGIKSNVWQPPKRT